MIRFLQLALLLTLSFLAPNVGAQSGSFVVTGLTDSTVVLTGPTGLIPPGDPGMGHLTVLASTSWVQGLTVQNQPPFSRFSTFATFSNTMRLKVGNILLIDHSTTAGVRCPVTGPGTFMASTTSFTECGVQVSTNLFDLVGPMVLELDASTYTPGLSNLLVWLNSSTSTTVTWFYSL